MKSPTQNMGIIRIILQLTKVNTKQNSAMRLFTIHPLNNCVICITKPGTIWYSPGKKCASSIQYLIKEVITLWGGDSFLEPLKWVFYPLNYNNIRDLFLKLRETQIPELAGWGRSRVRPWIIFCSLVICQKLSAEQ